MLIVDPPAKDLEVLEPEAREHSGVVLSTTASRTFENDPVPALPRTVK